MEEEITNGSLTWEARIDTSELLKDVKSIADILSKIGNVDVDTAALDNLLKEQAEKEVQARKDIAKQVIEINKEVLDDSKNKADELKKYLESIPFDIKTEADKGLSDADLSAIKARAKAEVEAIFEAQQYYNSQPKETVIPKPANLSAFTSTDAINQARDAYANADAVTKQYLDDLVALEFQIKGLKQAQTELNSSFKEGEVNEQEYLSRASELKAAIEGVNNEIKATKDAQSIYIKSLNGEGEATQKNITILTEYRQLRNKIASDQANGIINQADIDRAAELRKAIRNVNAELELQSSNTAFVEAAGEGVKGLVGAFTALSGAVGVLTDNNELANKIMQDTINFMGIINGIEQVSQVLATNGKLNQYIQGLLRKNTALNAGTVAQEANNAAIVTGAAAQETSIALTEASTGAKITETTATEGATVAQKGLNVAMELNPAAILILAITTLIAAYEAFADGADKAAEAQEKLNEALELSRFYVSDDADVIKRQGDRKIADMKAQGASAEAIRNQELQNLKDVYDKQKEYDEQAIRAGEDASKKLAQIKANNGKVLKDVVTYDQYTGTKRTTTTLVDVSEKEIDQLKATVDKGNAALQDKVNRQQEIYIKGQENIAANNQEAKKNADKANEDSKKAYEKSLANDVEYWQAKVALARKGSQEWLDAQLKLNQAQYNRSIQSGTNIDKANTDKFLADDSANDTFKLQQIKDAQDITAARLASVEKGSEQELALRLNVIEQEKQAALINAKDNAAAIERINAESLKKQDDLKKEFAAIDAERFQNIQQNQLKIILSELTQGTEEYLKFSLEANKQAAAASVTAAIKKAASENPAISANDISLSSIFDKDSALAYADRIESIDKDLAVKIRAIWAETNSKNQQDTNKFIEGQIDSANKLFDIQAKVAKDYNNQIISNQDSSALEKVNAQIRNNKIDTQAAQNQLTSLTTQLSKSYGEAGTAIQEYIQSVQGDFSKISELSDKDSDISHVFDGIKDPKAKEMLEQVLTLLHELGIEADKLGKDKFTAYADGIARIGDSVSSLGQDLAQYNGNLGNTISGIGQFVVNMAGLVKSMKSMSDELKNGGKAGFDTYASGISAAVSLIGTLLNAAAQRRAKEREYMAASIAQQREYNLALNDAILLNTKLKDNVFVTNYSGQIVDAWESISDATKHYNDALKDVENLQVKIGTAKKVDGNAVLKGVGSGAVLGAAVGSVVPVIGNVVGAVVGGVIGGVVGLFSKKRVDVYGNLFDKYPELFDKTKKGVDAFNDSLAQSLIDSNKVKDSSKEVLQSLIDWKKQVEEARQQMAEVVQTLAGNLGDTIANSLTDAFEQGTDAGKAFADSVKQTLENVIKQQLLNQVFGQAFTELQKRMEASFDPTTGGDMNWTDDLTDFFNQYGTLASQFEQGLQEAKDAAATAGLDIFQSTDSVKQGLAGAIQASITEDTANELAGLWRGQYDVTKQTMQIAKDALVYYQRIEANTAQSLSLFSAHLPSLTRFLPYLKDIYDNTTPAQIKRDLGL